MVFPQPWVNVYSATSLRQPVSGRHITVFCKEVAVVERLNTMYIGCREVKYNVYRL